ncbi:glycosyltransferase family 39 protein [Candidatus Saccharibacteria bacterium]|nr:glycosyltransferase family 39 protein [Candidatus Saccharibacteria bacterium]
MKSDLVQQITLYKYRYVVSFGVLALIALLVVAWQFWVLPDGLTESEIASATAAGHFSPTQFLGSVVNLPWTIMQWLSIKLFGATILAFRLPAVILMILSAVGLVLFLRKWARQNIAVVSGFWAVTSMMFIGLSRSGTPAAMTTFLIIMILLSVVTILKSVEEYGQDKAENQVRRSWQTLLAKIIVCVALALLCYQEAGIYLVALFIAVGVIHPKTRLVFLKSKPWKIAVGLAAGFAVLAPLIFGLVANGWSLIKDWLALDGAWSLGNLGWLGSALGGFEAGLVGGLVIPAVTLVALVVAFLGLMKICVDRLSARSYLTLALLLVTLTLAAWRPTLVYLLFVPLTLLVTVGIDTLIRQWYDLFPCNPYARILAVVPLAIMIATLGWTSITRFGLSQNYDESVVYHYNQEFMAARNVLSKDKDARVLVVAADQKSFYEILERDFPGLVVATKPQSGAKNIVLGSANVKKSEIPSHVTTSSRSKNAVLLRVY